MTYVIFSQLLFKRPTQEPLKAILTYNVLLVGFEGTMLLISLLHGQNPYSGISELALCYGLGVLFTVILP